MRKNLLSLLVILTTLMQSVSAGIIRDERKWDQEVVRFDMPANLPYRDDAEQFIHNELDHLVPFELFRDDSFEGDINIEYYPSASFFGSTRLSFQGERIVACTISIGNGFMQTADPKLTLLNVLIHEFGHCGNLDHTTQFVFPDRPNFKFPSKQQPLMAATGSITTLGYRDDDKQTVRSVYGNKLPQRVRVTIESNETYENIFLVNDVREYSRSQVDPVFNNVYPGKYKIALRYPGSLDTSFICRKNNGTIAVCDEPTEFWIQKNKTFKLGSVDTTKKRAILKTNETVFEDCFIK